MSKVEQMNFGWRNGVYVDNAQGERVKIYTDWQGGSKDNWTTKFLTMDCSGCSFYVCKDDASYVFRVLYLSKRRRKWNILQDQKGICIYSEDNYKILVGRDWHKEKHCAFSNDKDRKTHLLNVADSE